MKHQHIEERYQWLVDLLKKEFPNNEIVGKAFDAGFQFAVAIGAPGADGKRTAARVEGLRYYDDGDDVLYSLNDDPDKDAAVAKIISAFKKVAA